MKNFNLMLNFILIFAVIFLYYKENNNNQLFNDSLIRMDNYTNQMSKCSHKINHLTHSTFDNDNDIHYKNQKLNSEVRVEILSLLSIVTRYFSNLYDEHSNMLKILEQYNAYNEVSQEEKELMHKSLQENINQLRVQNNELLKEREKLKDLIFKIKNHSFE